MLILEKFDVEATATKSAKMRGLTAPGEFPRYERVKPAFGIRFKAKPGLNVGFKPGLTLNLLLEYGPLSLPYFRSSFMHHEKPTNTTVSL